MVAIELSYAQDDFAACRGVRSLQHMRRSRSTSAVRQQRSRSGARNECLGSDLTAKLQQLSANSLYVQLKQPVKSAKIDVSKKVVLAPLAPLKTPVQMPAPKKTVAHSEDLRTYFGQPISSYDELLFVAGTDLLDDDFAAASKAANQLVRSYYGNTITTYEEFYNLTLGDAKFDDEVRRQFFCREIYSYEELLTLGGDDAQFDDECTKQAKRPEVFSYFGQEIHSYEELLALAGADATVDEQ